MEKLYLKPSFDEEFTEEQIKDYVYGKLKLWSPEATLDSVLYPGKDSLTLLQIFHSLGNSMNTGVPSGSIFSVKSKSPYTFQNCVDDFTGFYFAARSIYRNARLKEK